jgi:V/A-type H+-transporting ATPase subunit I
VSIRPVPTRWFEVLVLKKDLGVVLECLAGTGAVQLQTRAESAAPQSAVAVGESEYDRLASRYHAWWPVPVAPPPDTVVDPAQKMQDALSVVNDWAAEADGTITDLQAAMRERDALATLNRLFSAPGADLPDLQSFLNAGPRLASAVILLTSDADMPEGARDLVTSRIADDDGEFLLVLGAPGAVAALETALATQKCRALEIPKDLPGEREAAQSWIEARLVEIDAAIHDGEERLNTLSRKHDMALALGEIRRLRWLSGVVPDVGHTQRLAWISGWTNDPDGAQIANALNDCAIHHFLAFPVTPPGANPPVILHNPPWSRPFEALTRMLGLPLEGDADPSMLVSVIAPILFGFMFGDVGQGFILFVAGLVLRRKAPALGALVPGGVMAMVFGLLFGSVFSREDVVPALWLHPLEHPIVLLVTSVAIGAFILLTGLVLDALQMHWHGRAASWRRSHVGLLVAYCGLLATAFLHRFGLVAAGIGVVWYIAGSILEDGLRKGMAAVGELVETLLQLAVNTVSFARVGAFALAHAGLSVAVAELADAAGALGYWPVLVIGNAFIIALEGLVVGIQTTRLVLFEFFIRFLHAGGREFNPLQPPHATHADLTGGTK